MTGSLLTDYLNQGTAASRPAAPDAATDTLSLYYATDTLVLSYYDWNAAAWVTITGASLATTTEVLTGTNTTKATTPDAIAALWEKGSDITSAGTISVDEGGFFHVTGTTTITDIDFATTKAGRLAVLVFDDALTLTHDGTNLILPTAANIVTVAGDVAFVWSEGGDVVRVTYYRKSGVPLFTGCKVRKSVDHTAADYDPAIAVTWDAEDYDTHAFHDGGSPTRLTIPAGMGGVYLIIGQIVTSADTADRFHNQFLLKDGASLLADASGIEGGTTVYSNQVVVTDVMAAGAYVEMFYGTESDASITVTTASFLSIQRVA
jgi:hypothetical protein